MRFFGGVRKVDSVDSKSIWWIGLVILLLSLLQILLGTQVREAMDEVIKVLGYKARLEWISELGVIFYVHRSFSLIVVAVNLFWYYKILKDGSLLITVRRLVIWSFLIILAEVLTGVLMAYFGVPPYAQPLHLTFAIGLIGLQFVIWLLVNEKVYLQGGQSLRD